MNGAGELLIFQVGARIYATEVGDVRRVGPAGGEAGARPLGATALGQPFEARRGIVVDCGDRGDWTLAVDQVLGLRRVAAGELHALPAFAAACMTSSAVTGFALIDEATTLLIDLPALVLGERRDAAQTPEKERDHA